MFTISVGNLFKFRPKPNDSIMRPNKPWFKQCQEKVSTENKVLLLLLVHVLLFCHTVLASCFKTPEVGLFEDCWLKEMHVGLKGQKRASCFVSSF